MEIIVQKTAAGLPNEDILCWIDMEESGAFCEVIGSEIDNPELLE